MFNFKIYSLVAAEGQVLIPHFDQLRRKKKKNQHPLHYEMPLCLSI